MDANELNPLPPIYREERPLLLVDFFPEYAVEERVPRPQKKLWLHVVLFIVTCVSTFAAGVFYFDHFSDGWSAAVQDGLMYSSAVMLILLCHEMGHFLQARRYGINATLPFFIPMPLTPVGTMGAVIAMEPRRGNAKTVFDIGITGPLAGLVPTLAFLVLGLGWSQCKPMPLDGSALVFGSPLLAKLIYTWMHGPIPVGQYIAYHPIAFAGWVGLLITSINLVPIGQLDGGHILYGMFRRKANVVSTLLLVAAIWASIRFWLPTWWLMLGLITFLGPRHPPTADDSVPLGTWRYVLGFATLAFIILGFTPEPFHMP
jgi:membrane-associated protease RseP (regulator of RpoE activity)